MKNRNIPMFRNTEELYTRVGLTTVATAATGAVAAVRNPRWPAPLFGVSKVVVLGLRRCSVCAMVHHGCSCCARIALGEISEHGDQVWRLLERESTGSRYQKSLPCFGNFGGTVWGV